jgi:glycerol-3-phosphate dehydrogenase subunit B
MRRRVVVIGSGASGTAAAWAATQSGALVTVVLGGVGASSLSSGALDGSSSEGRVDVTSFVAALGLWQIEPCRLATSAGLLRAAGGRDGALLNLERIEAGTVGVVDVPRLGWDAAGLARAWSSEPWAIERGLRFEAVAIQGLLHADEEIIPLADLAALHDDPKRVGWLVDRLRESPAIGAARALVMGPWLGLRPGTAAEIARGIGRPVGEPLSLPGGVSGLRFDRARDALLASIGVECVADWVDRIHSEDRGARITLASGATLNADAVVVASGGLTGGGIAWDGSPLGFTTSPAQVGSLAMHGRPLYPSGSPGGDLFESHAWRGTMLAAGIERVGVWADGRGIVRLADGSVLPWLHAAGDLVADVPRTMLDAIGSGLSSGAAAAVATSSA